MKSQEAKYHPFKDVDKNGVIIISPFELIGYDETKIVLMNISGQFNGKGLADPDPERIRKFNFHNRTSDLIPKSLDKIIAAVESLYTNEIDSLSFENLPGITYETLAGYSVKDEGSVQWERSDLNKLIGRIRMLYDSKLTRQ